MHPIRLILTSLLLLAACGAEKFRRTSLRGPACRDEEDPIAPWLPRHGEMLFHVVVNGLSSQAPIPESARFPRQPESGSLFLHAERPGSSVQADANTVVSNWRLGYASEPPFLSNPLRSTICQTNEHFATCGLFEELYQKRTDPNATAHDYCFYDPAADLFDCPASMMVGAGVLTDAEAEAMRYVWYARTTLTRRQDNPNLVDIDIDLRATDDFEEADDSPLPLEVFREGASVEGVSATGAVIPTFSDMRFLILRGGLQCRQEGVARPQEGTVTEIAPTDCCTGPDCRTGDGILLEGSIQVGMGFYLEGQPAVPQEIEESPEELPPCSG